MPVFPSILSSKCMKCLPLFIRGTVVKGFGRGSKQLGIPTANFSHDLVSKLPEELDCGVYYGWAAINDGPVNKMVMSVGWNPYFKNEKKSVETHIMAQFPEDFYGAMLRIVVLGYLRPEKNFSSVEELVTAIETDIRDADRNLDREEMLRYKTNDFFTAKLVDEADAVIRAV
uniref:Riboflavin kinase n=1 Tax=Ixodes ricinus TaxID=34613 RepID=A0A0K8RGW5_IXORI